MLAITDRDHKHRVRGLLAPLPHEAGKGDEEQDDARRHRIVDGLAPETNDSVQVAQHAVFGSLGCGGVEERGSAGRLEYAVVVGATRAIVGCGGGGRRSSSGATSRWGCGSRRRSGSGATTSGRAERSGVGRCLHADAASLPCVRVHPVGEILRQGALSDELLTEKVDGGVVVSDDLAVLLSDVDADVVGHPLGGHRLAPPDVLAVRGRADDGLGLEGALASSGRPLVVGVGQREAGGDE